MTKLVAGALAALTLASGTLAAGSPASAQPWRGYHHGGWGPGAAVGAGLLGFAVGTAIADHPRPYGYGPYYRPYYAPGYYGAGYYRFRYGGCRTVARWNPYWGEYQPVRACY